MSVYVCVRGNMHMSVCLSTCLYVSDCARVCALVCSLTTPCLTTEPLSQFCVGFDELVLPPTNRLESQSPVVLEMAEELRELVRRCACCLLFHFVVAVACMCSDSTAAVLCSFEGLA